MVSYPNAGLNWERLPRKRLKRLNLPKVELPRIKSLWVILPRARIARIGTMVISYKDNLGTDLIVN